MAKKLIKINGSACTAVRLSIMTLIEDLKIQRELLVKQVFESELMIVQQYLLGIVEGYERCIKLVEYYEKDKT